MTTTPQDIQAALKYLNDMRELGYSPMVMANFFQHHEETIRATLQSAAPVQAAGGLDALKQEQK